MRTIRNFKGFTLIELLVVIAIIAILAAILFPVFAKAREKARQISCASNERQVGLAILQYVQDNEEKFPAGYGATTTLGPNGTFNGQGWAGPVYPYAKSTQLFKCPDDSTAVLVAGGVTYSPISYAFNSNLAGAGNSGALASLGAPSNTVMLYEVTGAQAPLTDTQELVAGAANGQDLLSPAGTGRSNLATALSFSNQFAGTATGSLKYETGYLSNQTAPQADEATTGWHTDGANYLAGDGHVKWLRGSKVSPGVNNTDPVNHAQDFVAGEAAGTANSNFAMTFSAL